MRRMKVTLYKLTCLRCGESWVSKVENPKRCGKVACRSPYWNVPKKRK